MAPDPAINLLWLDLISRRLAELDHKQRLPLIVRIDDPWLAGAWRAQQFGGSDTRWAADVVGKYEVTAGRLLDGIIATGRTKRVFVCGTSQLTLALCADLTQRALERDFYTPPGAAPLPALTLVERDAEEYLRDHHFYRQQAGFMSEGPNIDAVSEASTIPTMLRLIGETDAESSAVILVDAHAATTASRLAARYPEMPVYASDLNTSIADDSIQVVGMLQSYSLVLDTREGQVQDAWERAARLIHERYVATIDPSWTRGPASVPWAELDEFYRGSKPAPGAQCLVDGRTDRWSYLEYLGHPAGPAVRPRHGGIASLGTAFADGLRPPCRLEHGPGRARRLVPLLPSQWLEIRHTPRRFAQDPRQAGRLVGGREHAGSAQCRGTQLGRHVVEPAPGWASGHVRCGRPSPGSARSPPKNAARHGHGRRTRVTPCGPPPETGRSSRTARPGRCATTFSRPPSSRPAMGSGAERAGSRPARRIRARLSTPWRAPPLLRTATGWCGAPTASNGRFPQPSSHSATPNSIHPRRPRSATTVRKRLEALLPVEHWYGIGALPGIGVRPRKATFEPIAAASTVR